MTERRARRGKCVECDAEILAKSGVGPVPKYCSNHCRDLQRNLRGREERASRCPVSFPTCSECGRVFTARRSHTKQCGAECRKVRHARYSRERYDSEKQKWYMLDYRTDPARREAYLASRDREKVERACEQCGKTWRTWNRNGKYCSDICKGAAYRAMGRRPPGQSVEQRAQRAAESEQRRQRQREARKMAWIAARFERECEACGIRFCPVFTNVQFTCSDPCRRRRHDQKGKERKKALVGIVRSRDFLDLMRRFNFSCAYCGEKPDGPLQADHVFPKSRGGLNVIGNILPACLDCNADKRNLTLQEWDADRAMRGKPPRLTSWPSEDSRFRHLTALAPLAA